MSCLTPLETICPDICVASERAPGESRIVYFRNLRGWLHWPRLISASSLNTKCFSSGTVNFAKPLDVPAMGNFVEVEARRERRTE